jgi:hypothetical protein
MRRADRRVANRATSPKEQNMARSTIAIGWKSQEYGHACAVSWKHVNDPKAGAEKVLAEAYCARTYPEGSWVVRVYPRTEARMLELMRAEVVRQTGATEQ